MKSNAVLSCLSDASEVELPANTKVFTVGDGCHFFYYILTGTIRVDLITWAGKPFTLYRFSRGETCILTSACLLSGDLYNAEAAVEEPVKALVIPLDRFQVFLESSAEFRAFVFSSFASRLSDVMVKIDELASIPIEQRLAQRLLDLVTGTNPVVITHGQLAADLGSAREVVSRKLASWEKKGWVSRSRGRISVADISKLEYLAYKK